MTDQRTAALDLTRGFLATKPARPLVVILGPTASGKTALSIDIARAFDGEIVSADSRQIYREIDLGTAKPTSEELAAAPHHLVSVYAPDRIISTAEYRTLAEGAIDDILSCGKLPLLVGSHTLLISAIIENYQFPAGGAVNETLRATLNQRYDETDGVQTLWNELNDIDPVTAAKIPPQNKHHLIRALELTRSVILSGNEGSPEVSLAAVKQKQPRKYTPLLIGLDPPREILYEKINARVDAMMADGLLDEVIDLSKRYDRQIPALRGHGYRELLDYLAGEKTRETAVDEIKKDTRHYAKRQKTWWRNCAFSNEIKWLGSTN